MKIIVAGEGAFGNKHLEALQAIPEVEVVCLVGGVADTAQEVAEKWGVPRVTMDLTEALAIPGVEAAILATPTPIHAAQSIQCMQAGKHVLVEIPMADSLANSEKALRVQEKTGLVGMVNHVRRFNPSHQWIKQRILKGEIHIQQLYAQIYFFRRTNLNALGQPRSWTDHLLWHHACHSVDLFLYQTGEIPSGMFCLQGPKHPELGIAMDMAIGLKTPSGSVSSQSLSFNNNAPLGSMFRYICDNGTWIARYDDLVDGYEKPVDLSGVAVSLNGVELADREFFAAIKEGREPNCSFAQAYKTMQVLDKLEQMAESI
jgi:2-hydroxy-4-carboxymuconate semialdehyde hemiacetal dehydrogenase